MIGLFLLCVSLVVAAAVIVTRSVTRPLGGEPDEVAEAVAFLCSPAASLFVGQTLGPNSGDVML